VYQTASDADIFSDNALSFDRINWEDSSLLTMPLLTEELEIINGLPMPYDSLAASIS
jgi:hypothetical protein